MATFQFKLPPVQPAPTQAPVVASGSVNHVAEALARLPLMFKNLKGSDFE
jgi:hypothetical protein